MQCREISTFLPYLYNSRAVYKYSSMAKLIKSYDLIGDVIIIRIPSEVYSKREIVAETLHKIYPRVRTIAAVPLYAHTNELYRTREVQVIWGDENLETTHRESGCSFKVDLKHVFFSPRLSYERMRVAQKVLPAETIISSKIRRTRWWCDTLLRRFCGKKR